jgi:hypothetical protein
MRKSQSRVFENMCIAAVPHICDRSLHNHMQFQLVAVVVTDAWKMSGGVCQIEKAIVGLTELHAGQRASNKR